MGCFVNILKGKGKIGMPDDESEAYRFFFTYSSDGKVIHYDHLIGGVLSLSLAVSLLLILVNSSYWQYR